MDKPKPNKKCSWMDGARICHHCKERRRWISQLGGGIVESFCNACNTKFIDISVPKGKVAGLCVLEGTEKIYRLSIKESSNG